MAQTTAIVVGHILAVMIAHRRALSLLPVRIALLCQIPMIIVMVGYTVGALLLLFTE